jgi:OOP family OmpA-OmpF porin
MKFRDAFVAAGVLALPMAAAAQPISGPYIGLGAGVNLMQDQSVTASNAAGAAAKGTMSSGVGPVVVGSFGWGFGMGLRAEIEASYRNNKFNGASGFGPGSTGGGTEQKIGGMANVLYDFNVAPWFQPYVGVGAGYQAVMGNDIHISGGGASASAKNDTKGAFAYQAILGAGFPISGAPGFAVTAEYRFLGLAGDRSWSATSTPAGVTRIKSTDDYNHAFLVGVRYAFNAGPAMASSSAAAVPAGPVAPSRSYIVFFDWDKADLTARAKGIIADAAANSAKVQYTKIDVNGYTDSSGTAKYNQGLSLRRANNVAGQLVKDGVPKAAIVITAFGETNPLVPTGPNTREPQNRRVEIIIR